MATLESSKLFAQLGPKELKGLGRIAQERTFAAGREIFKEGDAGDGMYLVKEGLVEISTLVAHNVRHVFSLVEPGDIFGEMAAVEDKPRSATAVAKQPTTVYFIPRLELRKLVDASPKLAQGLMREVSHRLREFNHQYLREVLQAERLAVVGRFARSIVHDLKNPLNIIGLTAEMATLEQSTPQMRRQAMESIRGQVDRINEMIGEIMDFTQGAPPDLVLPPMDYGHFVDQVLEGLRPEVALKAVTLELENPPPSVLVLLNPKRFRRVFHNLIHNATDALQEGGRIMLRFETRPAEVVTEVEDTGPGIAPEIAGQLFEAFVTFGKVNGTGLGLTICKRIVEDHHGWITARNQPGRGAVFAFGLPVSTT